jgi:ABC-type bacteriocin/lantibiotic exporter with double-glycine peptidase domain
VSTTTSWQQAKGWAKHRALGVILSIAAFLTMLSLFTPSVFDFVIDLAMIGLIALAGKLAR